MQTIRSEESRVNMVYVLALLHTLLWLLYPSFTKILDADTIFTPSEEKVVEVTKSECPSSRTSTASDLTLTYGCMPDPCSHCYAV